MILPEKPNSFSNLKTEEKFVQKGLDTTHKIFHK